MATTHPRSGAVAVLVAAAAVALAAFTATGSSHAASLKKSSDSATSSETNRSHTSSATTQANDTSTDLLNEWAACARSHGFHQADPTVEHQVIYIAVTIGSLRGGEIRLGDPNVPATCGRSLAAAQRAVAGGQPVKGWGDNAKYVRYANCMRANGYPTFPYPSGRIEPDGNESTNFNGTGIDPMSPAFLNGNANQTCGKQIGAPAWWINSWGPPGSVDVYLAGTNPNSPLPLGPPLPSGPKPPVPGLTGFSKCMRANGVPNFPDPSAGGGFRVGAAGVNPGAARVTAAGAKCQKFMPGGGPLSPGPPPSAKTMAQLRRIAVCMREHGVPQFPDPRSSVPPGTGLGKYREITNYMGAILLFPATIDPQSPAYEQATAACGARFLAGNNAH